MQRRRARIVSIGSVPIGGDYPIAVQSMTDTKTEDSAETLTQIERIRSAGCEIIRVAVPSKAALANIEFIRDNSSMPLVCDIHFDANLALACIVKKVAKVRINPGNLGNERTRGTLFKEIVKSAYDAGVALRIGVNAGSLEKDLLEKFSCPSSEALVESTLRWLEMAEKFGGKDVVLSCKSSDASVTVESNRKIASACDYPLHLGVTEAGTPPYANLKSAAGLAPLLLDGIGDTLRVSLLAPPEDEIPVCYDILQATGRRYTRPEIIACPACGRLEVNLVKIVEDVKSEIKKRGMTYPLKISVLGCVVNGPGEAREADVGIAAGKGKGILFCEGKIVRTIEETEFVSALMEEAEVLIKIKRQIINGKSKA